MSNETDLEIIEHTTDTGGYTDIIFALFDLLWLLFSPRLRDLANQSLCRIKGMDLKYPSLKFTSNFRPEYVRARWDDLLRVAATLKSGWVTSSLLISKLQGYPRQHHLTALLQEYGKLVKRPSYYVIYKANPYVGVSMPSLTKENSYTHYGPGYGLVAMDISGKSRKMPNKRLLDV